MGGAYLLYLIRHGRAEMLVGASQWPWRVFSPPLSMFHLEMAAALRGLAMAQQLQKRSMGTLGLPTAVELLCDNQGCVHCFGGNWGSRSVLADQWLLKATERLRGWALRPTWVPSELNRADPFTRGVSLGSLLLA